MIGGPGEVRQASAGQPRAGSRRDGAERRARSWRWSLRSTCLRSEAEWTARQEATGMLDQILGMLSGRRCAGLGAATTRNFFGPIQTIIPWADNFYMETSDQPRTEDFRPVSGASGCWAACRAAAWDSSLHRTCKAQAQARLQELMESGRRRESRCPAVCHGSGRLRFSRSMKPGLARICSTARMRCFRLVIT